MAKTTARRQGDLLAEAKRELDEIVASARPQRIQCLEDRRFCSEAGAQWDGAIGEAFANKPRFEFNKVHLAVIRIINEYRNNRITVDFQPKDGTANDPMADVCDGLYRADEQSCTANEAYDNAFEEAVTGGFGAWRLRACYEDEDDEDNERQRIVMEPIYDADSTVFFDLGAKRQDKRDAKRCYVLTPYTRAGYEDEWGDDPTSWEKEIGSTEFDWCGADLIWVCERYRIVEKTETVHYYRGLLLGNDEENERRVTEQELRDDPGLGDQLRALGFTLVRTKKQKRKQVLKDIFSGGKVLIEGELIPGKCIPIIPVFGKRWVIDGIERCMGHVRLAKDAQRLSNLLMSWLAEMAMRFDVEKPIVTPEQIAGHATMWAQDNIEKFPYLLLNPTLDPEGNAIPGSQAPVAYTRAPNVPPAMAALSQLAEQALQDLLGNQQAGEQIQPNLSGKAVELIQQRLDMQVFIYMSNLAKSMKRSGEVWLSMMKDIVVEHDRKMKTISPDGKTGQVIVNRPVIDQDTNQEVLENDLTKASYEVAVDVGPSSTSRRAAMVRAITGMLQLVTDPGTQQILIGLAMMNMEGEGLEDVRQHFRKQLLRIGAVKPTQEEAKQLAEEQAQAGQQPDPQAQYLMAEAEKANATAGKVRAETVETIVSAELKRAQTAKTLADADAQQQQAILASTQALQQVLDMGAASAAFQPAQLPQ